MTQTYPIVGAYFRPPAQALLDCLPVGAKLRLHSDPSGSYSGSDHNDLTAIAVYLPSVEIASVNTERLNEALAGYGHDFEYIMSQDEWMVGFIPKELARAAHEHGFPTDTDVEGEFTVSSSGRPMVRVLAF
jgi:hypothetical protein